MMIWNITVSDMLLFCFFQKHNKSRLTFILKLRGRGTNGHIVRYASFKELYLKQFSLFQKHNKSRLTFILKLRGRGINGHIVRYAFFK